MADRNQDALGEAGEDTDDLLYSDLEEGVRMSGSTQAHLPRDHCDLLLDAIDAQLSRLQAQSHAVQTRGDDGNGKRMDHSSAVFIQSHSVSKDTGLGSTLPTNDTSTTPLHMGQSETQDLSSEKRSGNGDPDSEEEEDDGKGRPSGGAVAGEAEEESKREQCRWRLELLLGRAEGGFGSSPPLRADSVCTEDFAARFREEMLEPLGGVGGQEAGPGNRSSGEAHALGPGGGAKAVGTQGIGAEMAHVIPALGKMVVGVKGLDGCHFGYHRAPGHDRDSPGSLGILISRMGQGQTAVKGNTTGIQGDRTSLGLHEQSRKAQHSQLTPPGGDTEPSGEMVPEQMELSKVQSPQRCKKPCLYQESQLTGGGSVSTPAVTDSTPLRLRASTGTVPTSDGTNQTKTPCTEGSGGVTMASLKHKPDVTAEKVNGSGVNRSGIRSMSRCLSCPETTTDTTDFKLKLCIPSPSLTSLLRTPQRDTETPLCPLPTAGRARVERTYENNVPSPYGRSCFGSALLDCTNGGRTGFVSAPGPPSSDTGVLTMSRASMNTVEAEGVTGPTVRPAVRHLAGVPVKSFDSVTIDSDLDSVRTDRVRKHFQNALRCGAAVRCARGLHLEDLYTDQSDPDLLLEPRSKFSLQSLRGNAPGGSRPVRKSRHPRRETSSAVVRYDCSDNEDTDEVEEEEEEQAGLSGLDPRGLVQRNSAPWRRRSSRLKRPHLRTLTGGWLDVMNSDRMLLEESLHALRQNCLREEERLKQKRDQLYDTEQSLTTLLQQKKHAVQELECARATAEQAQREGRGLEASLRDSRAQADSTRSQLRMLQTQRDDHMKEMIDLEEELTALRRHKAVLQERTGTKLEKGFHTNRLSVLEREELDRQLDSAKTELFAEQRRARHKLDSLQERLEEAQQELDQRVEEVRVLRESCTDLEEQLTDAQRHREELEQRRREEVQTHKAQVQELQGQLEEQAGRVGALERLLAQEEVGTQEQRSALQEEKRSLEEQRSALQEEKRSLEEQRSALQEEKRSLEAQLLSQTEAHCTELRQIQEQAGRDKELELEQLRSELSLAGEQEIQQVLRQAEEDKQEALKEQALSHTQHSDTLHARIQLKEEELRKLKDSLERQEESERERAEELRAEAQKTVLSQVRQAVEREHRKWEAQKGAELQVQQEVLEDQGRRALERASEEAERERRNSLALQNKIVELQTRVQEQDSEGRLQQMEHAAALAAVRRTLREEQQAELQRLRRHLEQEAQREVSRLQQTMQQAQGEAQALQAALAERGRSHEEGVSRVEQQQRGWATDLGAECQRLRELLEQCGATGGAVHLPHNPTVAQVVQTFHSMREQLYTLVSRLQQDLDTQRHATQQLSRDKERELRTQKEQLTVEREQALDSLRERLIQDHIEELSSLQRAQLRDSNSEAGGVAASLRRQLQEKDSELREVQRSMGRWKEQTAARLSRKFEEELTSELERCKAQLLKERRPRARMDQQRKLQRLETEMRQLTTEYGGPGVLRCTSTPSLLSLDSPAAPGPPDLATFKLLRHLQSRVRLLRAENSVQTCSPVHLGTPHRSTYLGTHLGTAGELAGSYLETIAPSSERCQVRSRVQSRTAPN